jgi:hypothetical protein
MNLTNLPELMRERSEHDLEPVLAESRMAGVERRVAASRRRRVAGALASIAVIAGVAAGVPIVHANGRPTVSAAPAPTVKLINGFPEYALGGHLVVTRSAPLRGGPISATITPTDLGFVFSDICTPTDPTIGVMIEMSFGSAGRLTLSCEAMQGGYSSSDPLPADGVHAGVPTTVTFTPKAFRLTLDAEGNEVSRKPMAVPSGTFSVALWQKVPFDQYPLPPRPKKLPVLDIDQFGFGNANDVNQVRSDPSDPLAPRTLTFTMPDCGKAVNGNCNITAATSQTPGYLHIAVNGVVVSTAAFWDYTGAGSSFDIEPALPGITLHAGELVTVTITPEHVTGAWVFAVAPGVVR